MSALGGHLWVAPKRAMLQIASPHTREPHKTEPFPGKYLTVAKILPVWWINRALKSSGLSIFID